MLDVGGIKNTRTEFLTGKLYEFISHVFEGETVKKDYVKAASDFIKNNSMNNISVASIAAELNLNSRYLSRLFKVKKGITIQEYIVEVKMKKACSLLSGGFNVSETANASDTAMDALLNMVYFGGFIAINLAVMNLLPIPALDGGRVVGLLLTTVSEAVTRKKIDPKFEGYIHGAGMILLLALMAVVMFKDIFTVFKG